ncbi:hypothetical protein BC830DRAFT_1132210, partial [Chytriomyces sp. MP71]
LKISYSPIFTEASPLQRQAHAVLTESGSESTAGPRQMTREVSPSLPVLVAGAGTIGSVISVQPLGTTHSSVSSLRSAKKDSSCRGSLALDRCPRFHSSPRIQHQRICSCLHPLHRPQTPPISNHGSRKRNSTSRLGTPQPAYMPQYILTPVMASPRPPTHGHTYTHIPPRRNPATAPATGPSDLGRGLRGDFEGEGGGETLASVKVMLSLLL